MSTGMQGPILQKSSLSKYKQFWQDRPISHDNDYVGEFLDFVKAGEYNTTDFTETSVDGGGDSSESIAVSAANANGELVITNNDADDDSTNVQSKVEAYRLDTSKKMWFDAKIKLSDVTQSVLFFGLCVIDTNLTTGTDRVGFHKSDGSTALLCYSVKDSSLAAQVSGVSMADDTYVRLSMRWTGSALEFYIDGTKVATQTTAANLPTDENLAWGIFHENGEAAAKTATIDYIDILQQR